MKDADYYAKNTKHLYALVLSEENSPGITFATYSMLSLAKMTEDALLADFIKDECVLWAENGKYFSIYPSSEKAYFIH